VLFATPDKILEGTGGAPDELEQLRAELALVKAKNAELEEALKGVISGGSESREPEDSEEEGEELSKEAQRKKLWRMCKKDALG
ncbi:unnamed protein product, partial [Symbiodinium sp. CCMP2456]